MRAVGRCKVSEITRIEFRELRFLVSIVALLLFNAIRIKFGLESPLRCEDESVPELETDF